MRGKGEHSVYRVPADKTKPLQYWAAAIELPPGPNGERRRKAIRRKDKKELLREVSRLDKDLRDRGDLPTANQTVEQWLNYWLREIAAKRVRPNTLDGYRRSIHNHIVPTIGRIKLEKVTGAHIRRVHDAVLAKGNNSTTALLAHRTMSVSFKAAVREGRLGRNPATMVDAPRKAKPALQALDLAEALQLLQYVADRPDGALWATVLLTGARRGEVIGLERDRVTDVLDLSWQMIRIAWKHGCRDACGKRAASCPQRRTDDVPADYEYRHVEGGLYWTRPKSSKGWRIIPLVDPLKSILEVHLAATKPNEWGLVFTRAGRPIGPDLAGKDWRKILEAADIDKDVRLHDGRHTTVDLLFAAGVPEDVILEIVGHSTRTQLRSYKTNQNRQRLVAAMEQFSALFADTHKSIERIAS